MKTKYALNYLKSKKTISESQADDLKIEKKPSENKGVGVRVWLSRMTVEDGMPYDNQVTVEKYSKSTGYKWKTISQYRPK